MQGPRGPDRYSKPLEGLAVLVLGGVYRRLFVVQERTAEQAEGVAQI